MRQFCPVMDVQTSTISPGLLGKDVVHTQEKKKSQLKMRVASQKWKEGSLTLLPAVSADIIACRSSLYTASLYNGSREAGMLLYQTIKLLCWITYNAITNDRMLASHQKFKEQ